MSNKESNKPAYPCQVIGLRCPHEETASLAIQNLPSEDSDQPARRAGWSESSLGAHVEGTFTDVAANIILHMRKGLVCQWRPAHTRLLSAQPSRATYTKSQLHRDSVLLFFLVFFAIKVNLYRFTVDSRYLEFQGTLWNTSRYPYLDISDLQNWGKNNSNNHI